MSKHTGKANRHEKIAVVLLSGKPVSPEEIAEVFKGTDQESVLYRLSTNIYNIRKDGGIVKVHKDGRKVKAYQLVNFTEFNAQGRYVGLIFSFIFSWPVYMLWNGCLVGAVEGVNEVTWLQAWGLNILAGFFFKTNIETKK